jgi:hypothetical protein
MQKAGGVPQHWFSEERVQAEHFWDRFPLSPGL